MSSESLLDTPKPKRRRGRVALALVAALVLHAGAFTLLKGSGMTRVPVHGPPPVTELVEVTLAPPKPAPPPEPTPAREKSPEKSPEKSTETPEATPKHAEPTPRSAPRSSHARQAPAAAAAQAGRALTAGESQEPVDFGDLQTGKGERYAGGTTHRDGTSKKPATDPHAKPGGTEGGTGTSTEGSLAQPPRLAGGTKWDCPFPDEADEVGIDRATVTLRIEIDASGRVSNARALKDPGHGFGREARRCALSRRWKPGLDRIGTPVASSTTVAVDFAR